MGKYHAYYLLRDMVMSTNGESAIMSTNNADQSSWCHSARINHSTFTFRN